GPTQGALKPDTLGSALVQLRRIEFAAQVAARLQLMRGGFRRLYQIVEFLAVGGEQGNANTWPYMQFGVVQVIRLVERGQDLVCSCRQIVDVVLDRDHSEAIVAQTRNRIRVA